MGIAESSTLTAREQSDDTLAQSSVGTVPDLAELASTALGVEVGDPIISAVHLAMRHMEWAEEEIESMGQVHPEHADRIWHSFALLRPTHDLMNTEFVYRSHCRELLQRIVVGEDTRPGTAAESCVACCETSQHAPMNIGGVGLYMRMWSKAGFPDLDFPREHHEAIAGDVIDDHEQTIRQSSHVIGVSYQRL